MIWKKSCFALHFLRVKENYVQITTFNLHRNINISSIMNLAWYYLFVATVYQFSTKITIPSLQQCKIWKWNNLQDPCVYYIKYTSHSNPVLLIWLAINCWWPQYFIWLWSDLRALPIFLQLATQIFCSEHGHPWFCACISKITVNKVTITMLLLPPNLKI